MRCRTLTLEQLEQRQLLAQIDQPPVLSAGGVISFTENSRPVLVAPNASVTDDDSTHFNRGTLTVINAVNYQAEDLINIRSDGTDPGQVSVAAHQVRYGGVVIGAIAGALVAGRGNHPLIVKFNEKATAAAVQAVVRQVQFQVLGDGASARQRKITFDLTGAFQATRYIYKTVAGRSLPLVVNKPADWKATDQRPAIVIMSNWFHSTTARFDEYCRYLSSRGMVCIQAEARTIPAYGDVPPDICINDSKSAMRWVRAHAAELGIDPNRIAAAGPSSGGQLAAASAMIDGGDAATDDLSISARANALLLINPVIDNGPDGGWGYKQTGDRYLDLSPAHNISPDDPPTILFFGDKDTDVPFNVVQRFHANMLAAGVRCDLLVYPGHDHGFWNPDRFNQEYTYKVLRGFDKFLTSLGWLEGPPTLQLPAAYAVAIGAAGSANLPQVKAGVVPINDAPVLETALSPMLEVVAEDTTRPKGTPVASLLGGVSDPDPNARRGIAITAAANSFGAWQFSLTAGQTWLGMGSPSATSARLIPGFARVRFIPQANFNGQVKLYYRAWDQTQGTAGSTLNLTGNYGGTHAFSTAIENAAQTVLPVNDAPVLNTTPSPNLGSILEDATNPVGTFVRNFASSSITDIDAGAVKGIAIVGASRNNGIWQFRLDGSTQWQTMGAVSESAAVLLRSDAGTKVRFIPKANFNGTVTLYFRAWDRTQGVAGRAYDLTSELGGKNACSLARDTAPLTVTPVNES